MGAYFKDFFGKANLTREFLWSVSRHGEIVIRRREGDEFVVCEGEHYQVLSLLNEMLRTAGLPLVVSFELQPNNFHKCRTWQDVADQLNASKSNSVHRHWRCTRRMQKDRTPIRWQDNKYIVQEHKGENHVA